MATCPDFISMDMKYNRNWAFEDMFEVIFVDGTTIQCAGQTDNKGQIKFIEYDGITYVPEQFGMLEIEYINFMTPARLEIKPSVDVLVDVYLRLAKEIPEAIDNQDATNAINKARIRSDIATEIHKRGLNMHELISKRLSQESAA